MIWADSWHRLVLATGEVVVLPLMRLLGLTPTAVDVEEIAATVLIALIQLALIAFVFRPLETWRPAERWADRKGTKTDRQYTLLMVLGVLPIPIFLAMTPLRDLVAPDAVPGSGLLHAIPLLDRFPYLRWLAYYIVFDFVYYWMHRAEHAVPWWWALHSLHHSQRQVSCWTNNRDCFLSGLMEAGILASVGLALGVEPSEFAFLTLAGELLQNFSHANVRLGFGRHLSRLLVGPTFHRLHHMVADAQRPGLHQCNFAQAFPLWDIVFGTALYGQAPSATGVADPTVDADNDRSLIGQQWAALRRFWGAVWRPAGWVLGDVSFGAGYVPVPDAARH